MLAQVKTKPLRGGPKGPVLTCPARAIRKVPRSGRRAGLQSNKELTNHLDTPNPHVSNPDCLCGKTLDCFVARVPRNDAWEGFRAELFPSPHHSKMLLFCPT